MCNNIYVIVFLGNIITFTVGVSISWSSSVLPTLENPDETPFDKAATPEQTSWISSLLLLASLLGTFIFPYMSDKIGRKYTIFSFGIPFILCYVMMAFGNVIEIFYVARILAGLVTGGIYTVIPLYIAEISEDSNRGALGSILNLQFSFGLLFSYSVGPYVPLRTFNLILAIFPTIFTIVFLFVSPESPHYYISKGKYDLAEKSLKKIRCNKTSYKIELEEIRNKIEEEHKTHRSFLTLFKSRGFFNGIIITVGLAVYQQLSGVNAILSYSQSIFQQTGTSIDPALSSIILGCVQLVTGFLTPLAADTLGRKIILIISATGSFLTEIVLGTIVYLKDQGNDISSVSFLPLMCLIIFIVTYNFGLGPLPWVLLGELFPSNAKFVASVSTSLACNATSFVVSKYFVSISDSIGLGPSFWIFSGFCASAIPFIIFYVIETKGKSLQQIQKELNKK